METRLVSAGVEAFSCAPNQSDLIQIVSILFIFSPPHQLFPLLSPAPTFFIYLRLRGRTTRACNPFKQWRCSSSCIFQMFFFKCFFFLSAHPFWKQLEKRHIWWQEKKERKVNWVSKQQVDELKHSITSSRVPAPVGNVDDNCLIRAAPVTVMNYELFL